MPPTPSTTHMQSTHRLPLRQTRVAHSFERSLLLGLRAICVKIPVALKSHKGEYSMKKRLLQSILVAGVCALLMMFLFPIICYITDFDLINIVDTFLIIFSGIFVTGWWYLILDTAGGTIAVFLIKWLKFIKSKYIIVGATSLCVVGIDLLFFGPRGGAFNPFGTGMVITVTNGLLFFAIYSFSFKYPYFR